MGKGGELVTKPIISTVCLLQLCSSQDYVQGITLFHTCLLLVIFKVVIFLCFYLKDTVTHREGNLLKAGYLASAGSLKK